MVKNATGCDSALPASRHFDFSSEGFFFFVSLCCRPRRHPESGFFSGLGGVKRVRGEDSGFRGFGAQIPVLMVFLELFFFLR